jgi:hypothetical protein
VKRLVGGSAFKSDKEDPMNAVTSSRTDRPGNILTITKGGKHGCFGHFCSVAARRYATKQGGKREILNSN